MGILSAVIGAGASIVGGLMKKKSQDKANKANLPSSQVKEWEKAGINPIVGVTQGQFIPQSAVSMGDAFATAGGILADGIEARKEKTAEQLKATAVKQENEALKKKVASLSAPSVPSAMDRYGVSVGPPLSAETPVNTDMGVYPMGEIRDPTPIKPDGTYDLSVNDGGTGVTLKPRVDMVTSSGTTLQYTEGPEWDELLFGAAGDALANSKLAYKTRKRSDHQRDDETEDQRLARVRLEDAKFESRKESDWFQALRVPPVASGPITPTVAKRVYWPSELGSSKPQWWDDPNTTNAKRLEEIEFRRQGKASLVDVLQHNGKL